MRWRPGREKREVHVRIGFEIKRQRIVSVGVGDLAAGLGNQEHPGGEIPDFALLGEGGVYRALKLRSLNPKKAIAHAPTTYLTTRALPPRPP